jgi:hypothetical protein
MAVISEQLEASLSKIISILIYIFYIKDTTVKFQINPEANRQDGALGQCTNFNVLA